MNGESILPFGKHKGKSLKDVPNAWFEFMYFKGRLSGQLKAYAEENVPIIRFTKEKEGNIQKDK